MPNSNLSIAHSLLDRIASGASAAKVAELASENLVFEIQGDPTILPWIGEAKHGRQALADFIEQQRELVQSDGFRVDDVLASTGRAVIVGELTSTLRLTGKVLRTQFAIVLTISEGEIIRFQMLEDSYAVSQAAR